MNMEPEIMAYNFIGHLTHSEETPTAVAIAPPHRLLLGLPTRCIEVRDLKEEKLLFSFRTVNQVTKLIHCLNGDYVATLETKHNLNNVKINYVRIYVNWYPQFNEEKIFHPSNVRLAGQHFHAKTTGFEMIEILGPKPDNMECCQISGNILIQSGKKLTIHELQMKKLKTTALKYVDFEEIPFYVEINFVPSKIAICENYISCVSKNSLNVFKIEKKKEKRYTYFKLLEDYKDYKKLLKAYANDVVVHLPGVIARNNAIFQHCPGSHFDNTLTCQIVSYEDDDEDIYKVVNFMQVKLKDPYEFRCLVLKPLYVQKNLSFENGRNAFPRSKFREHLGGIICFISTPQQGFLYQFSDLEDMCNCVSTYSFPEPVFDVVLGSSLLHALTKHGLESYTARNGQKIFQILDESTPDLQMDNDSVMLLGHHKVSGFVELLECDDCLVLLEDNDTFFTEWVILNWKLLHLEFPQLEAILPNVVHSASSSESYLRIMKELHAMLRLSTLLTNWIVDEDNLVQVVPPDCGLIKSYRKFSALLGDYFLMSSNYELSLPYYKMGSISPHQVLQRFKSLQTQEEDCSEDGILYYLTNILSQGEVEEHQNFLQEVESLFVKHGNVEVAPLILKNKMLRKSKGKLTDILLGQSCSNIKKETERLLALTLLYFENGNEIEAKAELSSVVDDEILHQILEENWKILFDSSGLFSKLCLALLVLKSEVMVKVLTFLMLHEKANSNSIVYALQKFDKMEETGIRVTQQTLELYFNKLFGNKNNEDVATIMDENSSMLREATKILVNSYWTDLKTLNEVESEIEINFLFKDLRFNYLDMVSPHQNMKTDIVLKKIEALFCSPLVLLLDDDAFVEAYNYPSLKSILLDPEESLLFLLETCPECLPQFGKDRFSNNQQWKVLVSYLREKRVPWNADDGCKFSTQLYKNLLDKILIHLAMNLSLDEFEDFLSIHNEECLDYYEGYVTLCRRNMRANDIQILIQETAKQVLLGFP